MATGRIYPKQHQKRTRGTKPLNGTVKVAEVTGPREQAKQAPVARRNGPKGSQEQAAITVGGGSVAPAPAAKNGAGFRSETRPTMLRFNVSLRAKLAKESPFSICVFSPDKNRGQVLIESIHVDINRKGESLFDGDVPVGKDGEVNPGTRRVLSFSDAQKKQLTRVLKSKTFASVTGVYTAPSQTEVTFSIVNEDQKKKKSSS